MISRDPRRALGAGLAVAEKLLLKLNLPTPNWSKAAEYSIAAQATRADMLYVARAARGNCKAVLCDYGFLVALAPFALAPDAPVLTVMHDLFSARLRDGADQVTLLTPAQEYRLLGQADVVLAIQETEAATVRAALPGTEVILAPHATPTVQAAQPGKNEALLFVGSNTAPNIIGLQWFFEACWPRLRATRPRLTLDVAGSVARGLNSVPDGVRMLGVVPDLTQLYREAGLVISPLQSGSGLKIKLIEAMAHGKAVVATTVTAQGVEDLIAGAVLTADEVDTFVEAIVKLSVDANARRALGEAALAIAQTHFSEFACFKPIVERLRKGNRCY